MDGITFDVNTGGTAQQHALNLAEVIVRGTARMLELQVSATRALLEMQGRNAALFGVPDWSSFFAGRGTDRLENLFQTSADQTVRFLRSANETLQQVQQQFGELVQLQTGQVTEQMRRSMEEMTHRSREGMERLGQVSDEAMQRAQRLGEVVGRESQRTEEAATAAASRIITTPSEPVAATDERARSRRGVS